MTDTVSHCIGVTVRGLRKSYDGQPVLRGIDLSVERGEIFVIMGPSGSGKSVLMKHIIGLEQPDEGDILLEGESIHSTDVSQRFRLAMVFQSSALLSSLSVGENVGLYLTEHRLRKPAEVDRIVTDKLELLGLKGVKKKLPSELSGGMKKRVAIARALVIDPHLILYDEPTSELDPLMTVTIGEEILALKERIHVTSLVVTHDRDLAFGVADRMAIMNEGEILFVGTPDEVRRNPHPFIRQFLNADFKSKQTSDPS
ncbi:MAG: ATP-binding cassette domain-containing protein [Verrucomicrobia bacterium]|nr:ATP-binding cassette domain-containing protein [Verrucomicrobiota bacterium]MBI3867967.1 ATP-binding cassette domain-containing protein [Verrucomicrobiota bacterium]